MKIGNMIKHFKKICTHKYWVFHYCRMAGIPWQGLIHDMSKFSPVEFLESAKYYKGDTSPIDACKKENGYSMAWFHHRGRNKHHYEYWADNFDNGGQGGIMPYKYALEMVCDYLAAGRAYMGDEFTYKAECSWWENKKSHPLLMHEKIIRFVDNILNLCANGSDEVALSKHYTKTTYKNIMEEK